MFTARTPFQHEHPPALAFYCSDGRFAHAVEELAASLGENRIDEMCLPGGPGLLDGWTSLSVIETGMVEKALQFLIVGHHIQQVLLVAHEGCGFYRGRYPDVAEPDRRERQVADLHRAVKRIRELNPKVRVRAFYASVQGQELMFEPVSD